MLAAPAQAAPELAKLGTSPPDLRDRSPGDATRVFVVEQPRARARHPRRRVLDQPFLDLPRSTLETAERARAALDGVRARLRDVRAVLRLPTARRRRDPGSARVPASAADPTSPTGEARMLIVDPRTTEAQPQRRPGPVRARRQAVARHRRRRRRQQPVRPRPGPGLAARQAAPPRPSPPAPEVVSRPAQPVALLVRPREGPLWIGDVGQDAYEEIDMGRRAETTAGRVARARRGGRRRPRPATAGRRRRC